MGEVEGIIFLLCFVGFNCWMFIGFIFLFLFGVCGGFGELLIGVVGGGVLIIVWVEFDFWGCIFGNLVVVFFL